MKEELSPELQTYFSERGKKAVAQLWKKIPSRAARRERMAVPIYARKVRLYGKLTADQWVITKFGEAKAKELLSLPSFRRQWLKHL